MDNQEQANFQKITRAKTMQSAHIHFCPDRGHKVVFIDDDGTGPYIDEDISRYELLLDLENGESYIREKVTGKLYKAANEGS